MMVVLCCLVGLLSFNVIIGESSIDDSSFGQEKLHAQRLPALVDDWREELAGDDLSDFERDVLQRAVENGRITQDDYEQAHARYLQCMAVEGYDDAEYRKQPDGLYKLVRASGDSGDAWWEASLKCSEGTDGLIEAEYREQQDNPQRYKDSGIVAVQCLRDAGKVDDSYTAARFNEAIAHIGKGLSGNNYSKLFGFPVHSDDEQTVFCTSLGGLSIP